MPVTICEGMRVGSPPSTSAMWIDTSVNAAEPTAIRVFVRKPAAR